MKFNEKLVLNSYILSLFGVEKFEELAEGLKDSWLENLDENNNTNFFIQLKGKLGGTGDSISIDSDKLREYDENIVRHTKAMRRDIKWKYFQYLALLFVEIYLDKYFDNKKQLLRDLNAYLTEFNSAIENKKEKLKKLKKPKELKKLEEYKELKKLEEYKETDLNKLALYSATGSGKTLLLQMNVLQFMHWNKGKMKINKTILITPNEGLSTQHLEEFKASNIEAEIFPKREDGIFERTLIEIIEITKLGEKAGDKTVAVDGFESNNLVFIDEGHRGSSGDIWKTNRDKLSAKGFAFEYSATFAQAINSSAVGKKKELENEYAKAIIFDYSYKYFYNDGYGKDYSILNLSEDGGDKKQTYLVGALLSFYQQMRIYESSKDTLKVYGIEKPLMVFVGATVNAVREEKKGSKKKVSDVVDILLFIDEFIKNKNDQSIENIGKLLSFDSGFQTAAGVDIFANKISFLISTGECPSKLFADMLRRVFNNNTLGGTLHLENMKGVDGEIALKIGEHECFGVINVGDSAGLLKLCEAKGMTITSSDFSSSLFKVINKTSSNVNILIGSKKFSEGWNSWRVSAMGLMNVGKKEGSQIIQLFGRGVRLKGYDGCLKRSTAINDGPALEKNDQAIETLSIFGIKADYMKAFKEYLESEGVPVHIGERKEFILPLIYDEKRAYKDEKLKVLDLKDGKDFKREESLTFEYSNARAITKKVELNLYKQVDRLESKRGGGDQLSLNSEILGKKYLSFVNIDTIFFELQHFKSEKGWSNISISKAAIQCLLACDDWYTLYIPKGDMNVNSFKDIINFEKIMITLLKKYMKSFYEYKRSEWESQYLEYRELDEKKDKANLIGSYTITVEEKEVALIARLKKLKTMLENNENKAIDGAVLAGLSKKDFEAFTSDEHLYNPLVFRDKGESALQIRPIGLNAGEKNFVQSLASHLKNNSIKYKDIEIFLLRNQSKTGLGFFTAGNFYPDFIMWIKKGEKQYINFIDPKGLVHLGIKNDSKIGLSEEIKKIEKKLNDEKVILNSCIVSVTPYNEIKGADGVMTKQELEDNNVFFEKDGEDYIGKMFAKILS